ncbi:AAA family ATPase [Asticcacaulis sp. DW145]|uniref:ATP-dependent nuclease n=1 Tax=Asticcacaulis sp. DW145 TaxID=3095608 RepID=UPI0030865E4B|nr:AAA family ATPase [Asticcacaulis sp. DW145]
MDVLEMIGEEPPERMETEAKNSGITIALIRIENFRGLKAIEVGLLQLTVILGANNAGKSSFLEAVCAAIGATRRAYGKEDIHLAAGESEVPRSRVAKIDLKLVAVDPETGAPTPKFPAGSYWTELFGSDIAIDENGHEFVGLRAKLGWNIASGEYRIERKFLKRWEQSENPSEDEGGRLSSAQLEPFGLNYIDAKRDLDEDLRSRSSFWRRLTDDIGLEPDVIREAEQMLSELNDKLVNGSDVLKHVGQHLNSISDVLAGNSSTVEISPVARKLRDLSRGLDVSILGSDAQSFPLARHGMGTRSLASLLVFQAYAGWRASNASKEHASVHSFLALEEPEAHLHPHAQRSLYKQISSIRAQTIVSTHSPYFVSQAKISQLRVFRKSGLETIVKQLDVSSVDSDVVRRVEEQILLTRGDLLFSSGIVLFEGETEEVALPIMAERYWNRSIHELGLSFVPVGGGNYFPFIWLATNLDIPWFVLSDAEKDPLKTLDACLKKVGAPERSQCPNVFTMEEGLDFEAQLLREGYAVEVERAFNKFHEVDDYVAVHIETHHGQKGKKGVIKDFNGEDGRHLALLDAMRMNKTAMASSIAREICDSADVSRRTPPKIKEVFSKVSETLGWVR